MKEQRISLVGPGYGFYVEFLGPGFRLWCNLGESSAMDMSIEDVRALFTSIALACERQEAIKTRIGRLSWTTDARPNPKHPERLLVKFSGPLGSGNVGLNRRHVLSACTEFSSVFG